LNARLEFLHGQDGIVSVCHVWQSLRFDSSVNKLNAPASCRGAFLADRSAIAALPVLDLSAPFPGWAVMLEDLPVASNAEVDRDKPSDRFGPRRHKQILSVAATAVTTNLIVMVALLRFH
jgi:hypothetical protein